MADKTFDAIIIGGGGKGLVTAIYLAKYGGMEVGIFEKRHELGGGWSSEEAPAPGFISDTHATTLGEFYKTVLDWDFPDFEEKGGKWIPYIVAFGGIFSKDHTCIAVYGDKQNPNQDKTAESIARFSQHDADAWLKLWKKWKEKLEPANLKFIYNPPPPPGVPDPMAETLGDPALGIDPIWMVKTPLEVFRDLFDSEELISTLVRTSQSWSGMPPDTYGMGLPALITFLAMTNFGCAVGGTHSWTHACHKIFLENGGKSFTKQKVEKITIENGKAKGIRLSDGTEIEARKLIVSNVDPYNLCFRLIGEEYLARQIKRRVQFLRKNALTITWYQWAVHELPRYKAADFSPDINLCGHLCLDPDPSKLVKEDAWMKLGKMPPTLSLVVWQHSRIDNTRAPHGKYVVGSEQQVLSGNDLNEKEWRKFKKDHAEKVIETWQNYATNMGWDNIIGYVPLTPYDSTHLDNMSPEGEIAVVTNCPSQLGGFRPIPELARHKTPIENLYATGGAWHPSGAGMSCQGYNCYKIIAEDFDLKKPWEEDGRPF